jgi:hypothetical protein
VSLSRIKTAINDERKEMTKRKGVKGVTSALYSGLTALTPRVCVPSVLYCWVPWEPSMGLAFLQASGTGSRLVLDQTVELHFHLTPASDPASDSWPWTPPFSLLWASCQDSGQELIFFTHSALLEPVMALWLRNIIFRRSQLMWLKQFINLKKMFHKYKLNG